MASKWYNFPEDNGVIGKNLGNIVENVKICFDILKYKIMDSADYKVKIKFTKDGFSNYLNSIFSSSFRYNKD